jgi:drug/metabolite transporter (DMT)-like permease
MWIALSLVSACTGALWVALCKPLAQYISPLRMMLLFRLLLALLFLGPFLFLRGLPTNVGFWVAIAAISVLEAADWVIMMYGFERDYLATYGMYETTPLFTLLLASVSLREHFGPSVWVGVLAMVLGAFLFYRSSRFSGYGFIGALVAAVVNVVSKYAIDQVHPFVFLFLLMAWGGVTLGLTYALLEHRHLPAPRWWCEIRRVSPAALIYGLSMVTFFWALSLDTATRVTALNRTSLLFGFLLGYFMLREKANWRAKALGTALVVTGTIAISL